MKFSRVFLLGLAGSAVAQDAIVNGFNKISKALTALDSSVKALTDSSDKAAIKKQADALNAQSVAVVQIIKDTTVAVKASKQVNLLAAAKILTPAKGLETQTKNSINSLIEKKPLIVKAGQAATVLAALKSQREAAAALGDAVTAKMPSAAASLSKSQSASIVEAIDKGLAAYQ
jgi:hypothetical protein